MRIHRVALRLSFGLSLLGGTLNAADIEITHGPILGRLGQDHVGIWARTSKPGSFRVQFGTRANQLDAHSEPATTSLSSDNTGWVYIDGLETNTRYQYQIVTGNAAGATGTNKDRLRGTFRTLASPDDYRDAERNPRGLYNFTFEFGCGNHQRGNSRAKQSVPVFATILKNHADELNFAIQNGDWSYEVFREYSPIEWRGQVGIPMEQTPAVVRKVPNITGAWENCKVYLQRSDELAAWHRNMPVFFTYDDHEIVDDCNGAGSIGARPRRALYRDIGVQAWYDYVGWSNPVHSRQPIHFGIARLQAGSDILTDDDADFSKLRLDQAAELHVHWGGPKAGQLDKTLDAVGGDPNAGVYEIVGILDKQRLKIRPAARHDGQAAFSIGRLSYYQFRVANCDFLCIDTRGHRQIPENGNPKKKGISLLGAKQKAWLKKQMAGSDADCFFIVSSVNFMIPHIVDVGEEGFVNYDDSWTTFWHEREELIRFFDTLGKKVFILTGDLHNSFVVKATENVWEFASAPHNSGNASMRSEGERPPNGVFDSHGRKCFIRWSTWFDNRYASRVDPKKVYCLVSVNNVFHNPQRESKDRWQAYPHPQVMFRFHNGLTGKLLYAESIVLE